MVVGALFADQRRVVRVCSMDLLEVQHGLMDAWMDGSMPATILHPYDVDGRNDEVWRCIRRLSFVVDN